jgi:hypothetical protein
MPHYIALIHKDADRCYNVSFPDVPGVFTAGDTIDEAIGKAAEVLALPPRNGQHLTPRIFRRRAPSTNCVAIPHFRSLPPTR